MKEKHPSLYPDILFHFTTKEYLFDILNSMFQVSYSSERIEGKNTTRELAVPMVSFCDLKLSELKVHMANYGNYGIGLTKKWANEKGLNPVMYVSRDCEFTENFITALHMAYANLSKRKNNIRKNSIVKIIPPDMKILDAYRYMKNYESEATIKGEKYDNFRFADEREWRYVPSLSDIRVEDPFVAITNFKTEKNKVKYRNKIKGVKLDFTPDDIKYLIVKNDDEIVSLIKHIKKINAFKHNDNAIDILSSRILTKEQIDNDI